MRLTGIYTLVESSLKKIDQGSFEMTVEVGKEELAGYIKRTEDDIARDLKVDGFRKGKAPRETVRKKVGDQYILEQALDAAVQGSLSRALAENEVEVINVSGLNILENSPAKLVYKVNLTVFPDITLPELSKVKVHGKTEEVSEKEIDDALDYLRGARSSFVPKETGVEKGDKVEIDFEVTSGGLPVEGGVSKNHPLIVGDNKFIPGFEDNLIGLKAGESKKFMLKAPKDYFHSAVAGKDLDFDIKVVKTEKIVRPELNDAFAQGIGRFKDMDELKTNIKSGLAEEKRVKEKQALRLGILAKILEGAKIEPPKEMVDSKLDDMVAGFDNDLHAKGMELSFYLAHLNKTEDDLRKDWRPEAEKQVSFALILRKVAKENMIVATKEEVEQGADAMIQKIVLKGEVEPQKIDVNKVRDAVAADLVNEKVFEFLEKKCSA